MQPAIFPIDRFFPAAQYNDVCRSNRALVPMFFIARNQKLDSIKKDIKVNEDARRIWDCCHPLWGVTCLHVAVWRQDRQVIRYLLDEKKCDPTVRDTLGFLPVHYAEAIGNEKITQVVRNATKIDYVSYKVIWENSLEQPKTANGVPAFTYVNENGLKVVGDAAKFNELTGGATFTPTIFLETGKPCWKCWPRG